MQDVAFAAPRGFTLQCRRLGCTTSLLFHVVRGPRSARRAARAPCLHHRLEVAAELSSPPTFSNPFPIDPFAIPHLTFVNGGLAVSSRPELLGTLLWAVGIYLGLSQRVRLGEALRESLQWGLERAGISEGAAAAAATAVHTLPFLFAAFAIDAGLRAAAGGNSAWADAGGLTLAIYGGVYEAGRSSARSKGLDDEEAVEFEKFVEFASRRLERRGRCHLTDVRAAITADPAARRSVGRISDERLRRFIRTFAPSAIRSPNGFYRELSVVERGKEKPKF